MKRLLVLFTLLIFIVGCGSSSKSNSTSILGTWTIVASDATGASTLVATVVSSPCTVSGPIGFGDFTVTGPSCFVANNFTTPGSITGTGLLFPAQGALIGVPANPAPANSALNLLFVEANDTSDAVFTGSGTVSGGKMTGTWACDASSPACVGLSGTFSGSKQ
jgi:hypothetical protein